MACVQLFLVVLGSPPQQDWWEVCKMVRLWNGLFLHAGVCRENNVIVRCCLITSRNWSRTLEAADWLMPKVWMVIYWKDCNARMARTVLFQVKIM